MDIRTLRRDMAAVNDGLWVDAKRLPALGDMRVHVRGISSAAASAAIEEAVRAGTERGKAIAAAVPDHCLIGIEGLTEDGKPVPVETVRANMLDPAWDPLAHLIVQAVTIVDKLRESDTEAAAKN